MTSPMPLEDTTWTEDAYNLLSHVASKGVVFDAYTLEKEYGLRPPPDPASMWGPLFRQPAKDRLITIEEHRKSRRPSSKGSFRAVWRGLPTNEPTTEATK